MRFYTLFKSVPQVGEVAPDSKKRRNDCKTFLHVLSILTGVDHSAHGHHAQNSLNWTAFSATLHCLTGCAIGEVLGLVIGTALGLSNVVTIALAVVLAFLFGYSLTLIPLLQAGIAFGAALSLALASDTLSILTMELVDNVIMLLIPGAMNAGLTTVLFWGSLVVALVIAGAFAFPVNRWLIAHGKGHALVHSHH